MFMRTRRFVVGFLAMLMALQSMGLVGIGHGAAAAAMGSGKGLYEASIQAKHSIDPDFGDILDLNKHQLTLKKGKSSILKARLQPSGGAVPGKVTWKSSNPKIAKVSSAGKVTAVAPGTAVITATAKRYSDYRDQSGDSHECYVTVPAGSKDPKVLNANDQTYYYGKTKLKLPTYGGNYTKALKNVKTAIGGTSYYMADDEYGISAYQGLIFGSKIVSKAHTDIYIQIAGKGVGIGFGYYVKGKSPVKTNRGIKIGAKKSAVVKKYGLPTHISTYKQNGINYERYIYETYGIKSGRGVYLRTFFIINKKKGTVSSLGCYYGGRIV